MTNKEEVKAGEKKLKEITGGKLIRSPTFFKKMTVNGIKNKEKTLHHVRTQIKKELNDGTLRASGVERRVDELLLEASPNNRLITLQEINASKTQSLKSNILQKGKVVISIPYQKSGVNDAIVGGVFLGNWGSVLGSLNEGEIAWKTTDLLFLDEGVSVKSTGHVILYDNIQKVIMGEKGFAFTVVTIITHSGENLVYKTGNDNAEASKSIIEDNIVVPKDTASIDDLVKLAELHEKGLLTKEEFEMKKSQILGIENNSAKPSKSPEVGNNFCTECGAPINGGKFCPNCGTKIL